MLLVAAALLAAVPAGAVPADRCGWVENPTRGNWSLKDRAGTWVVAEQGGYVADGFDTLPDMTTRGWTEVNGSHGYGCGCMTVDPGVGMRVKRVISAQPLPLFRCRADRSLPRP